MKDKKEKINFEEDPKPSVEPLPKESQPKKKEAKFVEIDITTDDNYSEKEQSKIVSMVSDDAKSDGKVMSEWLSKRETDIRHYECEKPSILENLTKKAWMSDRNLGLCPATCDTYGTTLLATTWNPDTIHYTPSGDNSFDNRDNLERFTKWAVGVNEINFQPEADDYIHTKVTQGFSMFKVGWRVWYDWVDKRIWSEKKKVYDIKTERVRFEKGFIENISNLEDILMPRYGGHIQDLPHIIHVIHLFGYDLEEKGRTKEFMNVDDKWIKLAKDTALSKKREKDQKLDKVKAEKLGLADVTDEELRSLPVDIHVWYGMYTKGKKTERYRFIVDLATKTFLAGKPLRKITRSGKYPFVGGSFIKRPGFVKGTSMPTLIAPIVNAFNNVFNQKSDFNYINNCPFGFYKPDEQYGQQLYDVAPGTLYPSENPADINFPNLQRSSAWASEDIRILFELLEKLTGASSYFQAQGGHKNTATRDKIMQQKQQERFGLWVSRIQEEFCEAITMVIQLYQDWAPPKLGERVLGEDGKQLFQTLSIETLRGNYSARMEPDITAGSKTYQMQAQMWAFENLQQSMWFDPRVNAKGNWNLTAAVMKSMGLSTRYLPPEPKDPKGSGQEVKNEWSRFLQGDKIPEPPEGVSPAVVEHLAGHMKQKEEKYEDLDEEFRDNFDQHLFATQVNYQKFLQKVQQQKQAEALAQNMIMMKQSMGGGQQQPGQPGQPQQGQPQQQPGQPNQDVAPQPDGGVNA